VGSWGIKKWPKTPKKAKTERIRMGMTGTLLIIEMIALIRIDEDMALIG